MTSPHPPFLILPFLTLTSLFHLGHGTQVRHAQYHTWKYKSFPSVTSENLCASRYCNGSLIACTVMCSLHPDCTSFTYNPASQTCLRNVGDAHTFGNSLISATDDTHYVGEVLEDVRDGDWILVFRGQSYNGVSVKDTWEAKGQASDLDLVHLNFDLISKLGNNQTAHFRSRWLDQWPSDTIDQVRFELYKDGATVVRLVFNGTGSSYTDWFKQSRLIQSSYTDLMNATTKFFSLKGIVFRHFYVSTSKVKECHQHGWLVIEDDVSNMCRWSASQASETFPHMIYSKLDTLDNWNEENYGLADVMAVFIRLK
ncbi:uncharacterized protein LOC101846043 [Aplysia californica]|uniref:Uncharacterized protein LOC101846043 n=1 Tax=Aplysia californica TaxID=6500 RepID=A0ABM0K8J6_APLCA|nr:uncharacterized protein LOC101846043 [Aplysia californica]